MQAQCASEIFVAEQKHLPVICRPMTQKIKKGTVLFWHYFIFRTRGWYWRKSLYPVWISYDLGIERTASDQFSAYVCGKDGPVNSSERYRRGLYANKIHVKDTVVVPIYRKLNI